MAYGRTIKTKKTTEYTEGEADNDGERTLLIYEVKATRQRALKI